MKSPHVKFEWLHAVISIGILNIYGLLVRADFHIRPPIDTRLITSSECPPCGDCVHISFIIKVWKNSKQSRFKGAF